MNNSILFRINEVQLVHKPMPEISAAVSANSARKTRIVRITAEFRNRAAAESAKLLEAVCE